MKICQLFTNDIKYNKDIKETEKLLGHEESVCNYEKLTKDLKWMN